MSSHAHMFQRHCVLKELVVLVLVLLSVVVSFGLDLAQLLLA